MKLNEVRDNQPTEIESGSVAVSAPGPAGCRGQKVRSPARAFLFGFRGSQIPLYRRLPKRGFKPPFRKEFVVVNLGRLQKAVDDKKLDGKTIVDAAALREIGLFKRIKDGVRLLAKGELSAKLTLEVAGASKAAIEAVEKAGGSVTVSRTAPKTKAPVETETASE